jgi:DNA-binding XRE family transcriptional regulator
MDPPVSERRSAFNTQVDIPRLVRELRERTSLTQEKFAAKPGVTFPTINLWENGRAKPSPLALKQIEDLLRNMGQKNEDLLDAFFKETLKSDSGQPPTPCGPTPPTVALLCCSIITVGFQKIFACCLL